MNESTIDNKRTSEWNSAQVTLVALGCKIRALQVLEPLEQVQIAQKTVKDRPVEKLIDGLLCILAGGHGLVEINKRVRPEPAVQLAFGRQRCAEQSVVQQTLDACTEENVEQMRQALGSILRKHGQVCQHDYAQHQLILDIDLTGRACGRKAAFASKGYFEHQRNRRGRQEGYVVASQYHEIVVEEVYAGSMHLTQALSPLCQAAEKVLALDQAKREQTILRVDSGGGSVAAINWALARDYRYHGKDYSSLRVKDLVHCVPAWVEDPREAGRQIGWVEEETDLYVRPVRRIAVRCRKKNGQWGVGVIVSNLPPELVLLLTGQPAERITDPLAILLAYVYFYDQRGGTVELEIKGDKQGLGTTKRNKKRFAAQQMVTLLEALAHNLLVWARRWLAPHCPKMVHYGLLRLVRDALHVLGRVRGDPATGIREIYLNPADPLAHELQLGFASLLAQEHIAVILDKT